MMNLDPQGDSKMSAIFKLENDEHTDTEMLTVCCPRCENTLTLHQPDEELVDRLLATCDDCKSWFLTNTNASILTPILEAPDRSL
jgi:hypothetical protein